MLLSFLTVRPLYCLTWLGPIHRARRLGDMRTLTCKNAFGNAPSERGMD